MKKIILWSLVTIACVSGVIYLVKKPAAAGPYDGFAQCLTDKGVKFYGAFWCPHCQAQKKLFGKSVKKLPYIECSKPDGKSQTQICIDNNIQQYPTWVFVDGTRSTGELSFAQLAEKSQCVLPQ